MGLLGWFKGRNRAAESSQLAAWRHKWQQAVSRADASHLAELKADLDRLALPEDDVEVEREMFEGLQQVLELTGSVAGNGLPIVETGHRIVGTDVCHFSAPVSRPDDPAQPSGRLILTNRRAIFAGGAQALTIPWHAVAQVLQTERDVALMRPDRDTLYRFRCNSYGDALCGAFIARQLATRLTKEQEKREKEKRS